MFVFSSPYSFLLFAPLAFALWRMFRRARAQATPFPALAFIPRASSWRQRLAWLPPVLFALGATALILAAARPQKRLSQSRKSAEAIAINMVVDVSGSMMALDYATPAAPRKNRLDVVKEQFAEFVAKRPDDLIGLVSFGGYAVTRSPLTFDHDALLFFLKEVKIPGQDGEPVAREETQTAIGDGLALAVARLAGATNVASRIIVLLTDGESNTGTVTPEQATALAKQQGVKVYTIGIGVSGQAYIYHRNMFGQEVKMPINAPIDEEALRRIAAETGGLYFSANDKKGLETALEEISKLETTRIDQAVWFRHNELFPPFLAIGAALLLAAFSLAPKGRKTML